MASFNYVNYTGQHFSANGAISSYDYADYKLTTTTNPFGTARLNIRTKDGTANSDILKLGLTTNTSAGHLYLYVNNKKCELGTTIERNIGITYLTTEDCIATMEDYYVSLRDSAYRTNYSSYDYLYHFKGDVKEYQSTTSYSYEIRTGWASSQSSSATTNIGKVSVGNFLGLVTYRYTNNELYVNSILAANNRTFTASVYTSTQREYVTTKSETYTVYQLTATFLTTVSELRNAEFALQSVSVAPNNGAGPIYFTYSNKHSEGRTVYSNTETITDTTYPNFNAAAGVPIVVGTSLTNTKEYTISRDWVAAAYYNTGSKLVTGNYTSSSASTSFTYGGSYYRSTFRSSGTTNSSYTAQGMIYMLANSAGPVGTSVRTTRATTSTSGGTTTVQYVRNRVYNVTTLTSYEYRYRYSSYEKIVHSSYKFSISEYALYHNFNI